MATTAFLGLSNMSAGMTARLRAAGHELRVWNRARAVVAMLADDEASRTFWLGDDGARAAMAPSALAIECSTLSAGWVEALAAAARAREIAYLDCPVTGLPAVAAAGELTLLVGGSDETLAGARQWLDPISNDIIHFGAVGAGTVYKLLINLMGAVQVAGAAEGIAMAKRAGLDAALVVEALAKGQAASPQVVRAAGTHRR